MNITIINGPNLNLLGVREPGIYGNSDFDTYLNKLRAAYPEVTIQFFQSNIEGEIVNAIQENGFSGDGIILNAGGYTHTSVAIADAMAAIQKPVIEVHISNIYAREEYRRTSLLSARAAGVIGGMGLDVYEMALIFLSKTLKVRQ
jgi:3-dehydroquinate dehydratase-2